MTEATKPDAPSERVPPLRIGIWTYPMLWQRTGGLQVQIRLTMQALRACGVDAELLDPLTQRIDRYDVLHVFSAAHGNHLVLEAAADQGVPTLLTPVMQPTGGAWLGLRLALASRSARWASGGETRTLHEGLRRAVHLAGHVVALSDAERAAYRDLYGLAPERTSVIPNGVDLEYFSCPSDAFPAATGLASGYVLVVGSICGYKNQLGVVRATATAGHRVVLVGPVADQAYLDRCLAEGGNRVRYAGCFPYGDERLPSAYQHAGVAVLVSQGESFGLTAVEALAAGCPVVITPVNGLGLPAREGILGLASAADTKAISRAVDAMLAYRASSDHHAERRGAVARFSWASVAQAIAARYAMLVSRHRAPGQRLRPAVAGTRY